MQKEASEALDRARRLWLGAERVRQIAERLKLRVPRKAS